MRANLSVWILVYHRGYPHIDSTLSWYIQEFKSEEVHVTAKDLAEAMSITCRKASRHLKTLTKFKLVKNLGGDPVRYEPL